MSQNGSPILTGTNILQGSGLPHLKFGATRNEVLELLGNPDDIDRYSDADDFSSETWHYDDLELSLVLEEVEDWRVTTLTVSSDIFTFLNQPVVGMSKSELLDLLEKSELGEVVFDDWSEDEAESFELLSLPDQFLNFWILDDTVSEVQWGVPYNEEDDAVWPK